jgi:hypothetical protein
VFGLLNCSGHKRRRARLPSAKRRISGRFGKCFSRSLQKDFLKAGKAETRRAAGRRKRLGAVPEKSRSNTELHDHTTAFHSAEEARTPISSVPQPESRVLSRQECFQGRPTIQPHSAACLGKLGMPQWCAPGEVQNRCASDGKNLCNLFGRFASYPFTRTPGRRGSARWSSREGSRPARCSSRFLGRHR